MNEEEKKAIDFLKENILDYEEIDTSILLDINLTHKTILNLIEKLQKENEELKQDRNNNYQMIALAQNEMLGYIQGYEDGKKLKRSTVACVVENQQYYIIKKEIEHYKEYIEELRKKNKEYYNAINVLNKEKADWIRAYQEEKDKQFDLIKENNKYIIHLTDEQYKTVIENAQNDINQKWIQKVQDKIKEIQKEYSKLDKQVDEYINDVNKDLSKYYENKEKIGEMQMLSYFIDNLQELIEEREEK